jgi:hypothetical protein
MIPFTFRFASGEEVKEIPSNWRDVSFDKFLGIYNLQKDHDVIDRISILSGIPVDKLRTCQSSSMILVIDEIKFCYDISEVLKAASTVPADEKWQKWSVGTEEWGKLEAVKQQFAVCDKQILDKFMIEGKPEWEDLPPEVIEAIRLNRLNAGPIALLRTGQFFFAQVGEFLKRFSQLGDVDRKWQELEAGVEGLGTTFGVMLTIKSLTGGDPLKANEVLKVDAETIYMWLLMNQEESKYQERLSEIYKKKGTK